MPTIYTAQWRPMDNSADSEFDLITGLNGATTNPSDAWIEQQKTEASVDWGFERDEIEWREVPEATGRACDGPQFHRAWFLHVGGDDAAFLLLVVRKIELT